MAEYYLVYRNTVYIIFVYKMPTSSPLPPIIAHFSYQIKQTKTT